MLDHTLQVLSNGLRWIHHSAPYSQIAHIGIVINVGTRDELEQEHGLAHFLEHMLFKGTKKRSANVLLNVLDTVGGELNAYTTREKTCLYASVTLPHTQKAIAVLGDIVTNSIFPEKELVKERTVVIDEINLYKDNYEESVYEDLEQFLFPNHGLGNPILGTPESLNGFETSTVKAFHKKWYHAQNCVFAYSGPHSISKIAGWLERYFNNMPIDGELPARIAPVVNHKAVYFLNKNATQSYVCLGKTSYGLKNPLRVPFLLLNNVLGGDGMNSRLNLNIREKYGLVYHLESNFTPYVDTGLFTIAFGCEPKYQPRVSDLIAKELNKLRLKPLTSKQLEQAKEQFIGRILMAEENRSSLILGLAKTTLDQNKAQTLDEIVALIKAITTEQIAETIAENCHPERFTEVYYQPES